MAIVLRGASSTVLTASGSLLTMNKPAGTVSGDIILTWCNTGAAATTFSATGFTSVTSATGTNIAHQLVYRVADGTEGSTFAVTASSSHIHAALIAVYGGATGFDPAPAAGAVGTASASMSASSITPVSAGDTLVWFGCQALASATTAPALTVPSGYTTQLAATTSGPGSGTNKTTFTYGDLAGAAAGPTGTVIGTSSVAELAWGALLVSLRPSVLLPQQERQRVSLFTPPARRRRSIYGR